MTILDDHNPYPGLGSVRPLEGDQTREARRWAMVGLVAGLLWLGGLASIVAIASGALARAQLRVSGRSAGYARLALVDVGLGVAGVAASVWWYFG